MVIGYAYAKNNINVHYFNWGNTQKVTTRFYQEGAFIFGVFASYSRVAYYLDTTNNFVLVQISLKTYSFQAAGKNKIIAKNVFVCVCVCVCLCVCAQDVSKTKNLFSLERVGRGH